MVGIRYYGSTGHGVQMGRIRIVRTGHCTRRYAGTGDGMLVPETVTVCWYRTWRRAGVRRKEDSTGKLPTKELTEEGCGLTFPS
eukprot:3145967-Rhodomonas_salina.2